VHALESVFSSFARILKERLAAPALKGDFNKLSEDTICFFFAAALLEAGFAAHLIEMEVWHPFFAEQKKWATIDIRVLSPEEPIWIEVKFDKRCSNTKCGLLLNDLFRLALLKGYGVALMIYVAPLNVEKVLREHLWDDGITSLNLDTLHEDVKKPLKTLQEFGDIKVLTKRVCREEVGELVCLLYEINTRS
jgi:hypothetical protein